MSQSTEQESHSQLTEDHAHGAQDSYHPQPFADSEIEAQDKKDEEEFIRLAKIKQKSGAGWFPRFVNWAANNPGDAVRFGAVVLMAAHLIYILTYWRLM